MSKPRDVIRLADAEDSGLEWVGEQCGEIEDVLKSRLRVLFENEPAVTRAYLARGVHRTQGVHAVVLCLRAHADEALARKVGSVFAPLFSRSAFLDIAFIDGAREPAVACVCSPFYERAELRHGDAPK